MFEVGSAKEDNTEEPLHKGHTPVPGWKGVIGDRSTSLACAQWMRPIPTNQVSVIVWEKKLTDSNEMNAYLVHLWYEKLSYLTGPDKLVCMKALDPMVSQMVEILKFSAWFAESVTSKSSWETIPNNTLTIS